MRALHEIGVELPRTTVATVPVGTARTGEALQLLNEVAEVIDATTLKEKQPINDYRMFVRSPGRAGDPVPRRPVGAAVLGGAALGAR
jgi:hypothetical protein